jgi:hypothetical protein
LPLPNLHVDRVFRRYFSQPCNGGHVGLAPAAAIVRFVEHGRLEHLTGFQARPESARGSLEIPLIVEEA